MNILVLAAHPDDEVLGMGGTIKKFTKQKHNVKIILFATGIISRRSTKYKNSTRYKVDKKTDKKMKAQVDMLRNEAKGAAKILGVDTEKVYAATFGINAALCGVAGALISITLTLHPYVGLPYTVRSFMIVIIAGLGNLPAVAISGMSLGVFEEFADYILGTEFRIGAVFMLLVFILVYRRFKLSKKREYLK